MPCTFLGKRLLKDTKEVNFGDDVLPFTPSTLTLFDFT
ncbi:MAG: hypothetical protein ACJAVL_001596 [Bacteroidia bacterium]|jgi:hypothetical protein